LPGEGVIQLGKYGIGRNVQYTVTTDPASKLEYTIDVLKTANRDCFIQNKGVITLGGQIYFYQAWLNIFVLQISEDFSLRYFFCDTG
jgi:hypothetical protein